MKKQGKRPRHTSLRMVGLTGQPAPSWTPDPALAELANRAFRAICNSHAKPDLIRVYRNNGDAAWGRCWTEQRIITVVRNVCDPLPTLAHEVAHLRYGGHGKRHAALTEELLAWMRQTVVAEAVAPDHLLTLEGGTV
jgi:hypothetical protein